MRLSDVVLPLGARLVITIAPAPRPEGTVILDPIRVELFSETEFVAWVDYPRAQFDEEFPRLLEKLLEAWEDRVRPRPRLVP